MRARPHCRKVELKAIVWTAYGPPGVLRPGEVPQPEPAEHDFLVQVRAATVTAGDAELRRSDRWNLLSVPLRLFFGVLRPRGIRIPGQELAGEVVGKGSGVTRFEIGDRVTAHNGFRVGGYAQFAVVSENGMVVEIPDGVSYDEAAPLPTAGLYGLYFVRQGDLRPGQSVLVNGGGGSIGSYAIQLAKASGADVTGVDRADKSDFMRDLGADHVIDFNREDFTRRGDSFDVVLDVVDKTTFRRVAKCLKPGGLYLHTNVSLTRWVERWFTPHRAGRHTEFVTDPGDSDDLTSLVELVRTGRLRSVVDRRYPLEEAVQAHEYAETDLKRGHIILTPT